MCVFRLKMTYLLICLINHVIVIPNLFLTRYTRYERSHPVAKGVVDGTKGITYLNIGDGGNREGHSMTYLERPKWNAFRNGTIQW